MKGASKINRERIDAAQLYMRLYLKYWILCLGFWAILAVVAFLLFGSWPRKGIMLAIQLLILLSLGGITCIVYGSVVSQRMHGFLCPRCGGRLLGRLKCRQCGVALYSLAKAKLSHGFPVIESCQATETSAAKKTTEPGCVGSDREQRW